MGLNKSILLPILAGSGGAAISAKANGDGTVSISIPAEKITSYRAAPNGDGTITITVKKG